MPRPVYANKTRKYSRKYNKKKATKSSYKPSKKTVQKMVKSEIAKNLENKITDKVGLTTNLFQYDATSAISWPTVFCPASSGILQLTQGPQANARIGDVIKMKKWIINGVIYPTVLNPPTYPLNDSAVYVTMYIARRRDYATISTTIPAFYRDGGSVMNPVGNVSEPLQLINDVDYKIYYKRTWKMGNSLANNDFKLNHRFKVDICKLVCKNKLIKYDDSSVMVSDQLFNSINIFFLAYSATGSLTPVASTASYFTVTQESYIEYEDA